MELGGSIIERIVNNTQIAKVISYFYIVKEKVHYNLSCSFDT